MEIFSLIILTITFILALDWLWRPKLGLPSPRRIPVIGSILKHDFHKQLGLWAQRYGGVYTYSLLNKTFVVVSDYESNYEVLFSKGKEFGGRLSIYRFDLLFHNSRDIFSRDIGLEWKKVSVFTHQAIKKHCVGLTHMEDMASDVAELLVHGISHKRCEQGVIDPYEETYMAITRAISCLLIGRQLPVDHPIYRKFIQMEKILVQKLTLEDGIELDIMPWLRHFGNKTYKELCVYNQVQAEVYEDIKELMVREEEENESESELGVIPAMINELNSNKKGFAPYLDEGTIQAVMSDIIVAGISSSANSLYALLLVLAAHPTIQQKMYEEISNYQQVKGGGYKIRFSDRSNLPYTRACLMEILRYASTSPIVAHVALKDTDILGHRIPKGTSVVCNLWSALHDERCWDKPWDYNPNRFLDEDGNLVPSDHINQKRFLSFGAGPRECIGQNFAMTRLFNLTTAVINEFKISPVPGARAQHDPHCYKYGTVLQPPRQTLVFETRK